MIIFTVLSILYGYALYKVLYMCKLFSRNHLNWKECITYLIPIGFLGITINNFLLGMLNIPYSIITIWGSILVQIILILFLTHKKEQIIIQRVSKFKLDILSTLILLIIVYIGVYAISNYPFLPDEFSHWALQSKNIYIGKKLTLFTETGFETYPGYIPILVSSYYFLKQGIVDNTARIITTYHLIVLIIGLDYLAGKIKVNRIVKLLILLVITSMPLIYDISSSFYADTVFMCYYGLATVSLIVWINNNDKNYLNLSMIYLLGATWVKTDGLYLLIGQIIILLIIKLIEKKITLRSIGSYILGSSWLIILWKVYCKLNEFPTSRWGININLTNIKPMVNSMISQTFDLNSGGYLNIIMLGCIILMLFNYKNKYFNREIMYGVMIWLGNILFLGISYIVLFGDEAITAASYSRYMTRTIPIQIFIIGLVYQKFKQEEDEKTNLSPMCNEEYGMQEQT